MINIIAAVAKNGVIGIDGKLPWSLREDMARFKRLTMGNTVIMGANTYREIGKPLQGRLNIILSSNLIIDEENAVVATSLTDAIEYSLLHENGKEIFICGGESLYKEAIDIADRLLITFIDAEFDGDRFFPTIPDSFVEIQRTDIIDGEFSTAFCEYIRQKVAL